MDLPFKKTKAELAEDIAAAFKDLERHKKKTVNKYERHEQLGDKGHEGTTYRVTYKDEEYAMKTFKGNKSSTTLKLEAELQDKASQVGVAPRVVECDTVSKYIVMEKMDGHLVDFVKKKGTLLKYQQKRIIDIFNRLDDAEVFHGDGNIMNFMLKGKDIYLIDFGYAKAIDSKLIKKYDTSHPNRKFMTISLIMKLKELGCDADGYKYLLREVNEEDAKKYRL